MHESSQKALFSALRELRKSHKYADLKIHCGEQSFTAHKAIVCSRSAFFETACSWGQDDKPKDEIDLQDDDPRLIKLMLDYLYLLDYNDFLPLDVLAGTSLKTDAVDEAIAPIEPTLFNSGSHFCGTSFAAPPLPAPTQHGWSFTDPEPLHATEWETRSFRKKDKKKRRISPWEPELRPSIQAVEIERLSVNAQMYALADKYGIEDLKSLAKEKFATNAEEQWDTIAFVEASELVFDTTHSSDEGLRGVVFQVLAAHQELIQCPQWTKLLDSGNGLAWKLLQLVWA